MFFCMTGGGKDGRHSCSRSQSAVEDSLLSQCGDDKAAIGMTGKKRKTAARRMGEAAEGASCWLWSRQEDLSWKPGGVDGQ